VSINSCLRCNLRCSFCYLSKDQLKDPTLLPLSVLNDKLVEISKYKKITHVDLYGGEITLLDGEYIQGTIDVIRNHYSGKVSVITNLTTVPAWLSGPDIDLSVSWDYTEREQNTIVMNNMVALDTPFHVLMLASKGMIEWDDATMMEAISVCNTLPKLQSVEIKPYSTNQANTDDTSFKDYEGFVRRWIELSPIESRGYEFVTESNINRVLDGKGHAWSDDHIYVTPDGDFAVLEFDRNGHEYFLPVYDWFDYLKWVMDEYLTFNTNKHCGDCEFRGRCMSEHLRPIKNFDVESCSGLKGLLEWYRTTK